MRAQVVGVFRSEEGVLEAAQVLHVAGYARADLDLVTQERVRDWRLPLVTKPVHGGRLMERPEGALRCALRWALIGSLVVEVPVLVWVLLAFDSWATQLFLGGTLFGGFIGVVIGMDRGLEPEAAERYRKHLAQGSFVLAAKVHQRDVPHARGILLESGSFDVRTIEGNFIVQELAGVTPLRAQRPERSLTQ